MTRTITRFAIIFVLAVAGLSACATSQVRQPTIDPAVGDDTQIRGVWHLDTDTMLDDPKFAAMGEEQRAQATAMVNSMRMEMSFDAGTLRLVTSMGEKTMTKRGTYRVVRIEGNTVTIASKVDQKDETLAIIVTGDAFSMTQGGQTMRFTRDAHGSGFDPAVGDDRKIRGIWDVDKAKLAQAPNILAMGPDEQAAARARIESVEMEWFIGGGQWTVGTTIDGKKSRTRSDYKVTAIDGDQLTVQSTADGESQVVHITVDGDFMSMQVEDVTLPYKRR